MKRVISRKNLSSHDHSHQRGTRRTKIEPNGERKKKKSDSRTVISLLKLVKYLSSSTKSHFHKTVPIFSIELWNLTYSQGELIPRGHIYCIDVAVS